MKMRKKSDLPNKPCLTCELPFNWRKKWEKVWGKSLEKSEILFRTLQQ